MGLTFRGTKGSPLTHDEMDTNFREFVYSGSKDGTQLTLFRSRSLDSRIEIPLTAPDGKNYFIQVKDGDAAFGQDVNFKGVDTFRYDFDQNHFKNTGSFTNQGNVIVTGDLNTNTISGGPTVIGNTIFKSSSTFEQNLTVEGTLTANEFIISVTTSSQKLISGSNIFGNSADDIHEFTGSVQINGALTASAPSRFGLVRANQFSGSYIGYGGGLTGIDIFPYTGSVDISGPVTVNGPISSDAIISAQEFSGSIFSGSFRGSGASLTGIEAFPLTGSIKVSSSNSHHIVGEGKFGFGTTLPLHQVHIQSFTSQSEAALMIQSENGTGSLKLHNGESVWSLNTLHNDKFFQLDYAANGGENPAIVVNEQKRVGLGGVTASNAYLANNLVVETNNKNYGGMTIVSNDDNVGSISYADGTSTLERFRGFVDYDHKNDRMVLGAESTDVLYLSGSFFKVVRDTIIHSGSSTPEANLHVRHFTGQDDALRIQNTDASFTGLSVTGSSGFVGVGHTAPTAPLHINTAEYPSVIVESSTIPSSSLEFGDSTTTTKPSIGSKGNNLDISTNGASRMKVLSSGEVTIDKDSPLQKFHIGTGNIAIGGDNNNRKVQFYDTTDGWKIQHDVTDNTLKVAATATGNEMATFKTTGLDVSGSINATGDITAFHSSDERLKDNIQPIPNALDKVLELTGNTFDWNDKSDHTGKDVGVIAQEVENVLPNIVTTRPDGYKAVKYDRIVALLIEAIKEQQQEIDWLKKQI
jgi:hypothetical protein